MYGNIKLPIVAAGLAVALISISAPVQAETDFSTSVVKINYSHIDLSTQKGRVRLENRVDEAIRDMCGQPVFGTSDEADALRLCRAEARAAVDPQLKAVLAKASVTVASSR